MKKGNLKTNIILQSLYEVLNVCLPLITAPYVSRVLGVENLGIFSFALSTTVYFTRFAHLGTINHGTRSIAAVRHDKDKLNETFWSIFWFKFITSSISVLIYILYCLLFCKDNKMVALLLTFEVLAAAFSINWFFTGIEEIKVTVARNVIVRSLTIVSVFLFVKTREDLYKYVILMSLSTFVMSISLWTYIHKYIFIQKVSFSDIISHLKPSLMLFVPILAMTVYHTMDKTMLGILSNNTQSGLYYNADKIINIPSGILSGVVMILLPRVTSLISQGKKDEADDLFRKSFELTVLVSIALSFGIASISNEFVPMYFGEEFSDSAILVMLLAPVLIAKAISFTARFQFLIPNHMENEFAMSTIFGALVNFTINILLIPKQGALGAVIGTIGAEWGACLYQMYYVRKHIGLRQTIINCLIYTAIGIIMFIAVRIVSTIKLKIIYLLMLEVIAGARIFILLSLVFWKITNSHIYEIMKLSIKKDRI